MLVMSDDTFDQVNEEQSVKREEQLQKQIKVLYCVLIVESLKIID